MIHDLDISKWPDTKTALEWNCKVFDPTKVSIHNAKLFVSSLTSVTTAG